jgi:hypothetical protein
VHFQILFAREEFEQRADEALPDVLSGEGESGRQVLPYNNNTYGSALQMFTRACSQFRLIISNNAYDQREALADVLNVYSRTSVVMSLSVRRSLHRSEAESEEEQGSEKHSKEGQ